MTDPLVNLDLIFNEDEDYVASDVTLVGKLITMKSVNSSAINAVLQTTWNFGLNVSFKSLRQNTVSCTFKYAEDKQRIERAGPWSVKGHLLNLQHWDPSLSLNEVDFSVCKIWVQIHNLPPNRLNIENLQRIGKLLGDHFEIDESHLHSGMSRFVRIRVAINVTRALKPGCFISRETGARLWIAFKYERISDFCYSCGKLTCTVSACPEPKQESSADREDCMGFGPWLRAVRPSVTRNHNSSDGKPDGKENSGKAEVNHPNTQSARPKATTDMHLEVGMLARLPQSDTIISPPKVNSPLCDISNMRSSRQPSLPRLAQEPKWTDTQPIVKESPGDQPVVGCCLQPHLPITTLVQKAPWAPRVPLQRSVPTISETYSQLYCGPSVGVDHAVASSTSQHKRKSSDFVVRGKRQKDSNAAPMDVSFAQLSILSSPSCEGMPSDPVCSSMHPATEETTMLTEERVEIVRRRFIHIKREARQRGMQRVVETADNILISPPTLKITELAEDAGLILPSHPS